MAFHPYPQLIPSVFNLSGFAPPQPLTAASHWPWVDHPASGPGHATNNTPLGFGFPTATPHGLTSRHAADSQAHSSKGTPSHTNGALTDCKHMVSGTISLPSRGTFHHSLTVLIHYRSPCPSRLTQWSGQIHTRFHEPRATREQNPTPRMRNQLPDSHGLRPGIPTCSPHTHKNAPRTGRFSTTSSHNPACATPAEYHTQTV